MENKTETSFLNTTKRGLLISRKWAMPNPKTFLIPPIYQLVNRYIGDGLGWADPFSNENSPAEFTNDINPDMPTKFHLDAHDFAKEIPMVKGILFDPPYSLEQMKRVYENIGRKFTMRDGQIGGRWSDLKNTLTEKCLPGGLVISFGWNTEGFGKIRGFEKLEILIVPHGSGHNDTLVTVERKFTNTLF